MIEKKEDSIEETEDMSELNKDLTLDKKVEGNKNKIKVL